MLHKVNMNTNKIAKQIAEELKLPRAIKYDLFLRDYDNMVEVVGLVDDPTYEMRDFQGREMLFPKRWVTIGVIDSSYKVKV
jgi:hypothetical protein